MLTIDGARCIQMMVTMSDGVRLNTFVFLPPVDAGPLPVILQRTPYGITTPQGVEPTNPARGWLPDPAAPMRGSILRGWQEIVARGYGAVYQDCRGRHGSEGVDRVYADDASDGFDTLEWIADQSWSNGQVGLAGSSAGATTALAAASRCHPTVKAFFTQVGGSSIYDDVVYEGQSIEMERLWLWVANNVSGLSGTHRDAISARSGISADQLNDIAASARATYLALDSASRDQPAFVGSPEWMHLPLRGYPDFSVVQPHLDELLAHPAPDAFRADHDFRSTIEVPGFHATTWFDIFLTSVLAAFQAVQARVGNQRLWIGPNNHYFVYEPQFWARDPFFEWFDHWLKGEETPIVAEPAVFYSPRCWIDDPTDYVADDWRHAEVWPPPGSQRQRLHLRGDRTLSAHGPAGEPASYVYDPAHPVPTLGGRNMLISSGALDQRPVRNTPNYGLTYSTAILDEELTIAGSVEVVLSIESDCPDTDFMAKLIEHHPDGRAVLLMDGVTRCLYRNGAHPEPLEPGQIIEVRIHLGDIHHTFAAGSRIEVDVTSSNFPRRARNTNSGNPLLADDTVADIRVATNTVHHSERHPSHLTLPAMTDLVPGIDRQRSARRGQGR